MLICIVNQTDTNCLKLFLQLKVILIEKDMEIKFKFNVLTLIYHELKKRRHLSQTSVYTQISQANLAYGKLIQQPNKNDYDVFIYKQKSIFVSKLCYIVIIIGFWIQRENQLNHRETTNAIWAPLQDVFCHRPQQSWVVTLRSNIDRDTRHKS